ncbi:MAG: cation:proton antiporter [Sandaracinaceae bacterium]
MGLVSGWLARRVKLPGMTGQIILGAILGPSLVGLLSEEALHGLTPVTEFALSLIAVAVGNHLHIGRLRPMFGPLAVLLLLEATLTPLLVYGAVTLGGVEDWSLGLMLAAMAIATAPATVVAIVSEARARGRFVEKLMAAVALNNIACIVLFEVARALAHEGRTGWEGGVIQLVAGPLLQLAEPLVIGVAAGTILVFATRNIARSEALASVSIIAILFTAGLSELIGVSPLLSCLFLGVTLGNLTPDKDEIGHQVFRDFEGAIFALFFTLAGMELNFAHLAQAAVLAGLFVGARILGKTVAASLAMTVCRAEPAARKYLGLALIPQAGVAVGLVLVVQADEGLSDISQLFLAVGITAVAIAEVVGPLTTRFAIARSGDAGRDRPPMIDFLEPRDILTALDMPLNDAVKTLTEHLYAVREVGMEQDAFLREALANDGPESYLGHGLMVAHVALAEGEAPIGAMGLSESGFAAAGVSESVHCVLLLGMPPSQREHRGELTAAFSLAIARDPIVGQALFRSRDSEQAFELLHQEEAGDIDDYIGH